jgi:hypothetical protein
VKVREKMEIEPLPTFHSATPKCSFPVWHAFLILECRFSWPMPPRFHDPALEPLRKTPAADATVSGRSPIRRRRSGADADRLIRG